MAIRLATRVCDKNHRGLELFSKRRFNAFRLDLGHGMVTSIHFKSGISRKSLALAVSRVKSRCTACAASQRS